MVGIAAAEELGEDIERGASESINKILIVALLVGVVLAAGVSYFFATSAQLDEIKEKNLRIIALERKIIEKEALIEELSKIKPVAEAPTTAPSKAEVSPVTKELDCFQCHDRDQTTLFHVPEVIMEIEDGKGLRRRLCMDCHGPLGPPWSADKQLTDLAIITYDDAVGVNGVFTFPNKVPHSIHQSKIDAGAMKCDTCHVVGGEFIMPEADVGRGQVLVCQNCKFHPDGNYITVHIEIAGKKCTVCHTGDVVDIHKRATSKLGQL